jgi:hypothetical protein
MERALKGIWEPELIVVAFHRPYRVRHYPLDVGEHSFAFVRWTLNAIAILIFSATIFIRIVIFSAIHWL